MRTGLKYTLAGSVGGGLLDLLLGSARYEVGNAAAYRGYREQGRPVIFVLWHGRLLALGYHHRGEGVYGLASQSADGEYIARVLQHWGMPMVRGSSSRGGDTAFREMVRVVRAGHSMSITPDGPRGPREVLKPGVVQLAQLTGAPMIPTAAAASHAWWFTGWDRFMVPKPFARIAVEYGEPLEVPRRTSETEMARLVALMQDRMRQTLERAERRAGGHE